MRKEQIKNKVPQKNLAIAVEEQPTTSQSEEYAYLTKRIVANAAKKGFYEGARESVAIMGYNVIAKNGWIVKVNAEGIVIEKISPIANYNKKHTKTHLD